MKIVIPGGSGQVGRMLARHFHEQGHAVTVLSRAPRVAPWRVISWDGLTPGPWVADLQESDVCINLAGRSVKLPVPRGQPARDPRIACSQHRPAESDHRLPQSRATAVD